MERAQGLDRVPDHEHERVRNRARRVGVDQLGGLGDGDAVAAAYAGQLTNATDPAEARHDATHRVLDHYLHTAYAAHELLDPVVAPITLVPRRPGVVTERPADNRQALDWFTAERAVLLAAVDHAAAEGFDTHTWRLAQTLWTYLDRSAHWHDWAATGRAVSAVAGRIGDPAAEAFAHRTLANAYTRLGRLDEASTELGQALDVAVRTGDEAAQAHAYHGLAYTWEQRGHPERALDHARQALDRYRSIGYEAGQSHALNAIGWCHALLGDHEEALAACQQALTLQQKLADRFGQANTWDSLGYIHHHLGHDSDAVDCYHRAVTLSREVGDRYNEAEALTHLGDVHRGVGDLPAARDAYRQAVEILTDLDHPDADGVRARLSVLTG